MTLMRRLSLFAPTLLVLASPFVQADELDTLQFKAGETVRHDSNVFRLSDSANTQALLGTPSRSDTVYDTTLGLKLDKRYSLQRFELSATADNFHYNRFSQLDYTAVNYAAAWRWSLTPKFHGNLTTDRHEYIDYYADLQNLGELNHRTDRTTALDGEYELTGAWRLLGGAYHQSSRSSVAYTFEGDYGMTGGEAGLRYVFASGTSLAYRYKFDHGEYSGLPPGTLFFANNFSDRTHEFRLDWAPTGRVTLDARLAYQSRTNDGNGVRDFSGVVGGADATWAITAKTSLTGGLSRQLISYQTNTDSYFALDSLYIAPTWRATEKTTVKLRLEHGRLSFYGPVPGYASDNRRDTTNLASLSLEWKPLRTVTLAAAVVRDTRGSNLPGFDYKNTGISLSAIANF